MSRGRHAKPSGLLSRLFPGRAARRRAEVERARERSLLRELRYEVERVRALGAAFAADAAQAAARARRAEEQALAARAETEALRGEVTRLREELLWAWAEGRLPAAPVTPSTEDAAVTARPPAKVIDLREAATG